MGLTRSEIGVAGEYLLCARIILTSEGALELYRPVSDEDHTDVVAGRKGRVPNLAIQVKTCRRLDKDGMVEARAVFEGGAPRDDPALVYSVLYVPALDIDRCWVLPSADFDRLAYRTAAGRGRLALSVRIRLDGTDGFGPFEVSPRALGPRIAALVGPEVPSPANPPPAGSVFVFSARADVEGRTVL